MSLKEQDIVFKTVNGNGDTIIQMPITRVENVEGAPRTVNNKTPDDNGNIDIPSRHVGDEWHSFTGKIPAGGVPYCGQIVTRATYADLWAYAQEQGLVKTEAEWQAISKSKGGNVPFYSSGDGSKTFRMPAIVGYIKGASTVDEAGQYIAEGLPNIEASGLIWRTGTDKDDQLTGALVLDRSITNYPDTNDDHKNGPKLNFDASRSNSIYGNSDHVTPETAVVLYGVYAYGEITNVGALDAETLANGLATVETRIDTKLENTTTHIVESWRDGKEWYRKWSDGWVEQGGSVYHNGNNVRMYVDLYVEMADTDYSVVASSSYVLLDSNWDRGIVGGRPHSTTQIYTSNGRDATTVTWVVRGMMAQA